MDIFQLGLLTVLSVFYFAYFLKMFRQGKRGIATNQMGKGDKEPKTLKIEKILKIATVLIVPVEIVSILLNTRIVVSRALTISGIVIAAIGVIVFITAMAAMGDSWRAGIPDNEKTGMISNGIYRLSRNPAFLGFDLLYFGSLLAYPNIFHFVICVFTVCMFHLQILEEEKFLLRAFGREYADYKKVTARYFVFF